MRKRPSVQAAKGPDIFYFIYDTHGSTSREFCLGMSVHLRGNAVAHRKRMGHQEIKSPAHPNPQLDAFEQQDTPDASF